MFGDRFQLTVFADGAVLVDLESGAFFRVNQVGALVATELANGGERRAARVLEETYGVPAEQATADVAAFVAGLGHAPVRPPRNPLTFTPADGGFTMTWHDQPVLWLAADGRRARRLPAPAGARGSQAIDDAALLTWAAPHLLALRGRPVLHAAAVEEDGGVLAFAGASGAGKTTTARAFAAAGATLVTEDLLILADDGDVVTGAEAALRAWVVAQTGAQAAAPTPGAEVDAEELAAVVLAGPTLPLRRMLLLDATRRAGGEFVIEKIPASDAMLALLGHSFGELEERRVWRDLATACRRIASTVDLRLTTAPAGLDALGAAAVRYNRSSTR